MELVGAVCVAMLSCAVLEPTEVLQQPVLPAALSLATACMCAYRHVCGWHVCLQACKSERPLADCSQAACDLQQASGAMHTLAVLHAADCPALSPAPNTSSCLCICGVIGVLIHMAAGRAVRACRLHNPVCSFKQRYVVAGSACVSLGTALRTPAVACICAAAGTRVSASAVACWQAACRQTQLYRAALWLYAAVAAACRLNSSHSSLVGACVGTSLSALLVLGARHIACAHSVVWHGRLDGSSNSCFLTLQGWQCRCARCTSWAQATCGLRYTGAL
jgi:hypothetical protein